MLTFKKKSNKNPYFLISLFFGDLAGPRQHLHKMLQNVCKCRLSFSATCRKLHQKVHRKFSESSSKIHLFIIFGWCPEGKWNLRGPRPSCSRPWATPRPGPPPASWRWWASSWSPWCRRGPGVMRPAGWAVGGGNMHLNLKLLSFQNLADVFWRIVADVLQCFAEFQRK